jgi:hypothetical protein
MTNFEGRKELFNVLKIKHNFKKHWNDFASWDIMKSMNELLLNSTSILCEKGWSIRDH